ncbi:sensor histidine kinase [Streptomyces albospinus]|uniref:sensor histidine kinase n=1 Tax=Streptomyces albospinus TaxID=285515 RepID=UPI001670EAF1|nr:ATP-binding protein [Streptomyces albospinus]
MRVGTHGLLEDAQVESGGRHPLVVSHRNGRVHSEQHGPGSPAPVLAAPGELERILRNLLDNATRYAHHRVDVTGHTEPAAGRPGPSGAVVVEVRDDGPGIPTQQREHIFPRFTRLDEARARNSGGAGLGLAIARELAERHDAVLQATPSNTGAHFVLRWPQANPLPLEYQGTRWCRPGQLRPEFARRGCGGRATGGCLGRRGVAPVRGPGDA